MKFIDWPDVGHLPWRGGRERWVPSDFPDLARLWTKLAERGIPQAEKELALLRGKQDTAVTREKVYAREIEIAKRQVESLQQQDLHTGEISALGKKLEQLTARL